MATATVDATQPGATTGWTSAQIATLRSAIANILEADRRNSSYGLSPDEYQVLWMVAFGANDGKTNSVTTSATSVVLTYT